MRKFIGHYAFIVFFLMGFLIPASAEAPFDKSIQGSGKQEISELPLNAGWLFVALSSQEDSNFKLMLRAQGGKKYVASAATNKKHPNTMAGFFLPDGGTYSLAIAGRGEYKARIFQSRPDVVDAPYSTTGTGSVLLLPVNLEAGRHTIDIDLPSRLQGLGMKIEIFTTSGDSLEILWPEFSTGDHPEATAKFRVLDSGTYIIAITYERDWRIKIE